MVHPRRVSRCVYFALLFTLTVVTIREILWTLPLPRGDPRSSGRMTIVERLAKDAMKLINASSYLLPHQEASLGEKVTSNEPSTVIQWNANHVYAFLQTFTNKRNPMCDYCGNQRHLINVTVGCNDLFHKGPGTGNILIAFYAMRLAAAVLDFDVQIACPDVDDAKAALILPWITGSFPTSKSRSNKIMVTMGDDIGDVCNTIRYVPIGYLYREIQYELRQMAVAMVGLPPTNHSTFDAVKRWLDNPDETMKARLRLGLPESPLYPNTELDDAVIHFRCGDSMDNSHGFYGLMKYRAFTDRISPDVRSIGIVTQPFDDGGQNRRRDRAQSTRERCSIVVNDFSSFVQENFPNARVRLRNDSHETIALHYARLILANQTLAGIGTFAVFPVLSTFGTGYTRSPDAKSPINSWLLGSKLRTSMRKNLVLTKEPNLLMMDQIRKLWMEEDGEERILAWFRNASLVYD